MRRTSRLGIATLALLVISIATASDSSAQGQTDSNGGGTRLVVSRESDPTPAPTLSSVYQTVVVRYWDMVSAANAKLSALSFAPARSTPITRGRAVQRRQIR